MKNRPLSELELRASIALTHASQEVRDQCIAIARERSPSAAFDLATRVAFIVGASQMEALGVAKATRWLAVIRRDHGIEKFNEVAGTLAAISTPKL